MIYIQSSLDEIKSFIDLIKIRTLCENILSPNGKIIVKLFDGDKIIDLLEKKIMCWLVMNKQDEKIRKVLIKN